MAAPNFELITELQTVTRRDFPLAAALQTYLSPTSGADALVDGEWLDLTQVNGQQVLARTNAQKMLSFPVHTEKGRYDTQAIGKVTILMLGMYEADTRVYNDAGGGDAIVVGTPLICAVVSNKRVLQGKATPAVTDVVVGYCTKVAAGGKIRFVHFGNVFGAGT